MTIQEEFVRRASKKCANNTRFHKLLVNVKIASLVEELNVTIFKTRFVEESQTSSFLRCLWEKSCQALGIQVHCTDQASIALFINAHSVSQKCTPTCFRLVETLKSFILCSSTYQRPRTSALLD